MRKRTLLALTVSLALTFGGTQLWIANAWGSGGAAGEAPAAARSVKKKRGNSFLRALGAPFRSLGKLFGGDARKGGREEGAAAAQNAMLSPYEPQPSEAPQPFPLKEGSQGTPAPKIERTTERDEEKFVSLATVRVLDSLTADAPATAPAPAATAQERLERGRRHLKSGATSAAIAELSGAVSLDPQLVEAHNLLGIAYDRKGLYSLAQDSYGRALRRAPRDPQILNNLGFSLYLSGRHGAAIRQLKLAAKYAPQSVSILNNLALAQCRAGKCGDAFESFRRAGGDFLGHLNVARLLERFGRAREAVRHLESARGLQPKSAEVMQHLARLYQQAGRLEEAEAARRTISELSREAAVVRGRSM